MAKVILTHYREYITFVSGDIVNEDGEDLETKELTLDEALRFISSEFGNWWTTELYGESLSVFYPEWNTLVYGPEHEEYRDSMGIDGNRAELVRLAKALDAATEANSLEAGLKVLRVVGLNQEATEWLEG